MTKTSELAKVRKTVEESRARREWELRSYHSTPQPQDYDNWEGLALSTLLQDVDVVEDRAMRKLLVDAHKIEIAKAWERLHDLSGAIGIMTLMMDERFREFTQIFETGDSMGRDAVASIIGSRKFVFIYMDFEAQTWNTMLNCLHEMAHLLTSQFDLFEEQEGVAQVELMLAKLVSPKVYDYVIKAHEEEYSYIGLPRLKRTKKWKAGVERAKRVLFQFPAITTRKYLLRGVL